MSIVVNKTRLPVTEWQTESGSVVSISDARKRYAKSLSVALEPIQDLSHGDPSPTNICPISGHSAVTLNHAGTNQSDNPTSITVQLGQTVYGGSVDLVSGVMTVTKKSVTFIGDNTYYWYTYAPSNYDSFCFIVDLPGKSKKKLTSICDKYKNVDASWGAGGNGKYCVFSDHVTLARLYFRPPYSGFGETVADWKTWLSNNPLQVCYELATPQTIQLSPNQIEMLMRNNTVWSDAGVVTLNYARIRS